MISLIFWTVFGSVVGGVAKAILPGRIQQGWLPTIAVGIAGSIVGGLPFGSGPAGFVGAVLGALLVIYAYEMWRANRV